MGFCEIENVHQDLHPPPRAAMRRPTAPLSDDPNKRSVEPAGVQKNGESAGPGYRPGDQEVPCKRATVHLQRWGEPRALPLENLY
jgi:hypothetical protein